MGIIDNVKILQDKAANFSAHHSTVSIGTITDKFATKSVVHDMKDNIEELERQINTIKKYNKRRNWINGSKNTYNRRRR